MREQEFARFFLFTEIWVSTSGVQKVWTGLKLVCMPKVWTKSQVSFSSFSLHIWMLVLCEWFLMHWFAPWTGITADTDVYSILVCIKFATGLHTYLHPNLSFRFGMGSHLVKLVCHWFALCLLLPRKTLSQTMLACSQVHPVRGLFGWSEGQHMAHGLM